ncbi:MAG: Cell shape determining protein, MreB/Mrl family [Parcubacteria group bacterium GW2011_GWF2_38_76]|nr:MAG: Cell shape determining protein, MreB/Mrl family [Parcubacteria group bacterium GW2011_GWF2_38_76]HBM46089.1 rod shape-determining protein [Patescibacteria group bacterium]
MKKRFYKYFSSDIGIDLGTANTLVFLRNHGIVIDEPSVVAINTKTNRVVAIGKEAKMMIGRTPHHITAVRPLVDGVISDFEVTEEMIGYFIRKTQDISNKKMLRPRVLIGVPSGITNVERRAVRDAAMNSGAREVHLIEEPMSAAIGVKLPVHEPMGSMIIDIGGGTTDIAVISLNGIVQSKNLRIAGDRFNQDIISYIRDEFKILLGEKTAEDIKIAIGSACEQNSPMEYIVKGRDLVTGLPREVVVTDHDVREAISSSLGSIINSVKEVIERTPPEIVADVMHKGAILAGGGALIKGLTEVLQKEAKIPVHIADEPLKAVVCGTGTVLENFDLYEEVLIDNEDEIPPQ